MFNKRFNFKIEGRLEIQHRIKHMVAIEFFILKHYSAMVYRIACHFSQYWILKGWIMRLIMLVGHHFEYGKAKEYEGYQISCRVV